MRKVYKTLFKLANKSFLLIINYYLKACMQFFKWQKTRTSFNISNGKVKKHIYENDLDVHYRSNENQNEITIV